MASFSDKSGRKWDVSINYGSCARIKELTGINLLDIQQIDKHIATLRFDQLAVAEIVLAILEPEITIRKMTREDVSSQFDGDTLEAASNAILEGLENFSPSGRRKLLTRMITKAKELERVAIETTLTSGDLDSSLPESSESIHQNSLSDN